ncbi:MAG TPA: alpha/beta hydrolase [Acidimicrobiales bacterium]|nr:alpha/beta hydrolase [Acidimicrobiales bacterium]
MTLGMIHRRAVGPFAVDVWEGGTGRPLLFLHGYERHPGDAAFLRRLARHHHVWAPEQPGYGTSLGGEQIHDVLDLVLFYRALIRDIDAGPVDLLGHSSGGMLAAEIAAIAPDVVRRLVLVDAFGLWLDEEPATDPFGARHVVLKAKWHDPANRPNPEPTNFVPEPDDPQAAALFQARNYGAATRIMWPIAERGLSRRLRYVTAPTLVVHGADDGLLPVSYAEEMVRLIDGAHLAVIDRAGHYPMLEQEDAFIEAVEAFLSK